MGLESATFINQLVATNPVGAVDPKSQGDDHLRMLKFVLLSSWPNIGGAVTASHTTMNSVFAGQFTSGSAAAPSRSFTAETSLGSYRHGAGNYGIAVGGVNVIQVTNAGLFSAGALFTAAGSSAAPAHSFTAEATLGMWRNSPGTLGFGGNGNLGFAVDITGRAYWSTGSAALPGLAHVTDTGMGFSRVSANVLGISTSGTLRVSLSATLLTCTLPIESTAVANGAQGSFHAASSTPGFMLKETDGAANNQNWLFYASGEQLNLAAFNDAGSGSTSFMTVDRTGTTIDAVNLVTPLLRANGIHNGTAPTGATDQFIASGTYTPTVSGTVNVAANTPAVCQWMRVGNVVTVSGALDVDCTAATTTSLQLSLPVASNLTAGNQLGGIGVHSFPNGVSAFCSANAANNTAQFDWVNTSLANVAMSFQFTYLVLN